MAISNHCQTRDGKIDLVVCLLPKAGISAQVYHSVKRLCCVDLGIPSQCVRPKSIEDNKKVRNICSKIVQQINCKLGGQLWQVNVSYQLLCDGFD